MTAQQEGGSAPAGVRDNAAMGGQGGGGWIALTDRMPPERRGYLLVTNNLNARDAFGFISHLWLVRMAHQERDGSFSAFRDDGYSKVENLTHWRFAVPEFPL